jgi:hypothetical protein
MVDLLKTMNDRNPAFGALRVRHPGDLARDRVYVPQQPLHRGEEHARLAGAGASAG